MPWFRIVGSSLALNGLVVAASDAFSSSTALLATLLVAANTLQGVIVKWLMGRNDTLTDRLLNEQRETGQTMTEVLTLTNSTLQRVIDVLDEREYRIRSDERSKVYAEMGKDRGGR